MPPVLAAVDPLLECAIRLCIPVGVGVFVAQNHVVDVGRAAQAVVAGIVIDKLLLWRAVRLSVRRDDSPALVVDEVVPRIVPIALESAVGIDIVVPADSVAEPVVVFFCPPCASVVSVVILVAARVAMGPLW